MTILVGGGRAFKYFPNMLPLQLLWLLDVCEKKNGKLSSSFVMRRDFLYGSGMVMLPFRNRSKKRHNKTRCLLAPIHISIHRSAV